jgi:acyl carrier protein
LDQDARKTRGTRHRGQAGAAARPAAMQQARRDRVEATDADPAAQMLAAVIAEVLPRHDPTNPPDESAELYADLFIDSRRFLMIIRGLERALNLEIDDEDLLGVDLITYGDLIKFVDRIAAKSNG